MKLNSNGVEIWSRFFGGGGSDELVSLEVDSEGNWVAAGWTQSTDVDGESFASGDSSTDALITKLDGATGTTIWTRRYGASGGRDGRLLITMQEWGDALLTKDPNHQSVSFTLGCSLVLCFWQPGPQTATALHANWAALSRGTCCLGPHPENVRCTS
eukprot:Skav223644  [mRNA]  locus=scaffold46:633190:636604:- [translate_table: standard]